MLNQSGRTPSTHIVLGAGPAGRATAKHLQHLGHEVMLASHSGAGPTVDGVRRVRIDATDPAAVSSLAANAAALYNCLNPTSYTRWAQEWPPIHAALMHAAQTTGAVLVTLSNLYMYGPLDENIPITPETGEHPQDPKGQIRAQMDREALAAHRDGSLRAVVVRASDFLGPHLGDNAHGTRNIPALARGRRAWVLGSAAELHSWTDIEDVAATLAAVATRPETHGRTWFAPTNPPVTQRELATASAEALDAPTAKVSTMPQRLMTMLGYLSPMIRELMSVSYQFTGPWIIDSNATTKTLGLQPTDWRTVVQKSARANLASDVHGNDCGNFTPNK